MNKAFCLFFGKSPDDLLSTSLFEHLSNSDPQQIKAHFQSLTIDDAIKTFEWKLITPSGDVRWLQITHQAIFDQAGRIIEFQSVSRDITELVQRLTSSNAQATNG